MLKTQLVLKNIITPEDWEEIRDPKLELPSNDLDYESVSKSEFMIG